MTKTITLVSMLAMIGACVDDPELDDELNERPSEITSAKRLSNAIAIRDRAAAKGLNKGVLLGGIAQVETGFAHCWSDATWACQGPYSSSCGGPVIAGAGDGPCDWQQGGLGMFQFDAGTYSQTLARDGQGILTLSGNIDHVVDFVADMVIHWGISGVGTRAEAIAWMNGITVANGNARFEEWKMILSCRYNGRCTTDQANLYGNATINVLNEFGSAFWTPGNDPQGVLDFAGTPSAGRVRVRGWAFDRDSTVTALKVNIYVGGVYAGQLTANQLRTDVDDVYHTGDYHGFSGDLSTIMFGGTRSVCVKAINVGGGANKSLGCKSVAFASLPQKGVDTFANADGRAGPSRATALQGYLYAGTSYVYCRKLGARVSDSSGNYNDWWLLTDLDTVVTGGNGRAWISAYYLSRWGNNVAKDNSGVDIPNCP